MKTRRFQWNQISIDAPGHCEEAVSALCVFLGSNGVWVEERGPLIRIKVYFPGNRIVRPERIRRALSAYIPGEPFSVKVKRLPEKKWETAWKSRSVPVQRIGKTLLILPPWKASGVRPGQRRMIQISPAMAFGTGTHPTTRSCLILLETLLTRSRTSTLLDVGTGSGILAIAAAKMGVSSVVAVDNDPAALSAARENIRVNEIADFIQVRKTLPRSATFSVITANLTGEILISLRPRLHALCSPGGKLILSGMLAREKTKVLGYYSARFRPGPARSAQGWWAVVLTRKS